MGLEVPDFDDLDAIRYSFSRGIRIRASRSRFRPFWDRKFPKPNFQKGNAFSGEIAGRIHIFQTRFPKVGPSTWASWRDNLPLQEGQHPTPNRPSWRGKTILRANFRTCVEIVVFLVVCKLSRSFFISRPATILSQN